MHVAGRMDGAPGAGLRVRQWSEKADAFAVRQSAAPRQTLLRLFALVAACGAFGIAAGLVIDDDAAAWFREGMPGTWLSAAMLLFAAAGARAVHRRETPAVRWYKSFWGLSSRILAGLVVVELTQPTIYLGNWLEETLGTVAPFGITDVDAALLVFLLVSLTLILAHRALVLFSYPAALVLFVITGMFAFGSQALDSFVPVTQWEFVAEESLKAIAESFLIAAYLTALRYELLRDRDVTDGR